MMSYDLSAESKCGKSRFLFPFRQWGRPRSKFWWKFHVFVILWHTKTLMPGAWSPKFFGQPPKSRSETNKRGTLVPIKNVVKFCLLL